MHKTDIANRLDREINLIEEKYAQIKQEIKEGEQIVKTESTEVLDSYVNIIMKSIISLIPYTQHEKEAYYQTELLGHLKSDLKQKFGKTKVFVEKEYKIKHNKRLDIYIQVGNYRIGIETKYDLISSGQIQRLLGQIDQYSEDIDALIIIQYKSIENEEAVRDLNNKKKKSNIPIRIIAGGVEI